MALFKPRQIDLDRLAVEFGQVIIDNPSYLHLWATIYGLSLRTQLFSLEEGTLVLDQTDFVVLYEWEAMNVDVFRNGAKQILGRDYELTIQPDVGFTIILLDPIGPSIGAVLSEIIEIKYF